MALPKLPKLLDFRGKSQVKEIADLTRDWASGVQDALRALYAQPASEGGASDDELARIDQLETDVADLEDRVTSLEQGGDGPALLVEDLTNEPLAAYSSYRRLSNRYHGPAFQVRRDSDSATKNIYFVDNVLDESALTAFCTGANGFVVTLYDQTFPARHITNATAAQQPKIFDSGSGVLHMVSAAAAMTFDGSNDDLSRADAFGLTGNQALTVAWASDLLATGTTGFLWGVGGTGADQSWCLVFVGGVTTEWLISENGGSFRTATTADISAVGYRIATKDATSGVGSYTLRENGTDLSMATTGAGTLNMTNTSFTVGSFNDGSTLPTNMKFNSLLIWNSQLSTTDRDLVDTELALHIT